MKNVVIVIAAVIGLLLFLTWKPSTESIVNKMDFGEQVAYEGENYRSDWGEKEVVSGYLRRIDRHYDKLIPIITYSMVVTSEDFNDPELVDLSHKGGGSYYWKSKIKPKGSLTVYHTIPGSVMSQQQMDLLSEGVEIEMTVRASKNNQLTRDSGPLFRVGGHGHKIVLVEDVL